MNNEEKYIKLYSKERINGYLNIDEHEKNFKLIGSISEKIGRIEVILRNKIDVILTKDNSKWFLGKKIKIKDKNDRIRISEAMFEDNGDLRIENIVYKKSQIISFQSLGFWFNISKEKKLFTRIFRSKFLKSIDLKDFFVGNKNKINKKWIRNSQKGEIILSLFTNLRNRAFHWENLYKIINNKPRLKTRIYKTNISLHYEKINYFLDLILKELIESGEEI